VAHREIAIIKKTGREKAFRVHQCSFSWLRKLIESLYFSVIWCLSVSWLGQFRVSLGLHTFYFPWSSLHVLPFSQETFATYQK